MASQSTKSVNTIMFAAMIRNHSALLNLKEKACWKQVRNLLIFESGASIAARKYSDILNIQMQVKCVFKQKCQNVDISSDFLCDTLSHLPIHAA
jgi:hypothetical protein